MQFPTLEAWVNINSGSHNPDGLKQMADTLEARLKGLPGQLERLPLPAYEKPEGSLHQPGDALRLRFRPEAPVRVLFNGHMDTVYEPSHSFQRLRDLPDGRVNGPGVADMKGGLYILIEAVDRFLKEDKTGLIGGEILITGDEEVGSLGSYALLVEAAQWNHLGLVFESAMPGGELVRCRKGSGTFRIIAHGKSAHTGRDFEAGRNAIVALAAVALECHALNQRIPDSIVNVGTIAGGGTVNVVPAHAEAWLNVRISKPDTVVEIKKALQEIIAGAEARFPGIRMDLSGGFARTPKEETPGNAALHELWNQAVSGLGFPPAGKRDTGGSSDGNVLGEHGLPHLDGVGILGGALHSEEEFAIPESIPEQIAKTVAFLHLLARQPDCLQRAPLLKGTL